MKDWWAFYLRVAICVLRSSWVVLQLGQRKLES